MKLRGTVFQMYIVLSFGLVGVIKHAFFKGGTSCEALVSLLTMGIIGF